MKELTVRYFYSASFNITCECVWFSAFYFIVEVAPLFFKIKLCRKLLKNKVIGGQRGISM